MSRSVIFFFCSKSIGKLKIQLSQMYKIWHSLEKWDIYYVWVYRCPGSFHAIPLTIVKLVDWLAPTNLPCRLTELTGACVSPCLCVAGGGGLYDLGQSEGHFMRHSPVMPSISENVSIAPNSSLPRQKCYIGPRHSGTGPVHRRTFMDSDDPRIVSYCVRVG